MYLYTTFLRIYAFVYTDLGLDIGSSLSVLIRSVFNSLHQETVDNHHHDFYIRSI